MKSNKEPGNCAGISSERRLVNTSYDSEGSMPNSINTKAYKSQPKGLCVNTQAGITLIELLVAVVILGVLFAFALPAYQSSMDTTEEGVVRGNMESMELFQEDFFLRTGAYANNLADLAAITAAIGWEPRADDGITYSIANSDGTFYQVTAVHPDGLTVCVRYPERVPCP